MGKRRVRLSDHDLINGWMVKYHGLTIEEAHAKEPWAFSQDFYKRYPVTQAQHDEWYEWMIDQIMKDFRIRSRKYAIKNAGLIYLNTSPSVIKEDKEG